MSMSALTGQRRVRGDEAQQRLERIFKQNYTLVWRLVRRLGLPPDAADDAAQQVFLVAAERLDDIAPESERAFVFGTALRVARTVGRKLGRELHGADGDQNASPLPRPDELADQKRARELLDAALDRMSPSLRTVFVLYEIEGFTMPEVAQLVGIPLGTAASRMRRARERFRRTVRVLTGIDVQPQQPTRQLAA